MTPSDSFSLGPLTIYWYSVFILFGIIAGYYLARPAGRRAGIMPETLQLSIFFGVIPGLVGARLYHVVDQWAAYADAPLDALAIWNGGLAIFGGLAAGALGLWCFAKIRRIPFLVLADTWAPSVLLAQALGRFGNWTNQEAYGPPTDLPWGIYIDPYHRPLGSDATRYHPTFFYEAAFDALGVVVLVLLRKRLTKPGAVLGAYLAWYGVGRFLVEFLRTDTATVGTLKLGHVIALALVGIGVYLIRRPQAGSHRRQGHQYRN